MSHAEYKSHGRVGQRIQGRTRGEKDRGTHTRTETRGGAGSREERRERRTERSRKQRVSEQEKQRRTQIQTGGEQSPRGVKGQLRVLKCKKQDLSLLCGLKN